MDNAMAYPVTEAFGNNALVNNDQYLSMYKQSVEDPNAFWAEQAQRIDWFKPFTQVKDVSFAKDNLHINWFKDGELNVAHNCIDRHLADKRDTVALMWEPDAPEAQSRSFTYGELHEEVCRLSNVLLNMGIKRGDVVTIYMPMIPETVFAMLACARIGAAHSVVFGGFSPEALADRIENGHSRFVITADEGLRGGRTVPLKDNVDMAINHCHVTEVSKVLVVQRTGSNITWVEGRDVWYHQAMTEASAEHQAESMGAEDPLFILYTSGSTGKPKGVVHTNGGYSVYTSITHEYVFDYRPGDIHWCTADIGWITGHSYVVYGPLLNGASVLMFEGVPNHPQANRMAKIIDKYKVNILYTAPTAIRALMADDQKAIEDCDLSSLKIMGTAGEPINPEAWRWFHINFGKEQCPIMDTWWQTETGGAMLTPLPGATVLKPGSATRPFFGIQADLVDNDGNFLEGACSGNLVIKDSWPGQARTVYGDHQRFIDTYFSTYQGLYFTSDGARRDEDGYYWITGRVDDVLNVAGHRMGTAEIESALVAHHSVAEAAVVGYPHDIKGQGIYVYVTLTGGEQPSDDKMIELRNWVRQEIGAIASPDVIQFAPGLPKTRSGKIMRRILRKIATDECDQLGDISTLADPSVVETLVNERISPPVSK